METFEIRLKENGRIFSRHYEANSPEQAVKRIKTRGKILSVVKVKATDIIGSLESMNLSDIIRVERRQPDVILDNRTLTEIIFSKRKRRFSNGTKKEK